MSLLSCLREHAPGVRLDGTPLSQDLALLHSTRLQHGLFSLESTLLAMQSFF
jgi:hypothetical protein